MTKQPPAGIPGAVSGDSSGAGAPEIEITPDMIQAGIEELRGFCGDGGNTSEEVVRQVFAAMFRTAPRSFFREVLSLRLESECVE